MENQLGTKQQDLTVNLDSKVIKQIKDEIDITKTQEILRYGVKSQTKISEFADNVLGQIQSKDSGQAGELLTDLMVKVEGLEIERLGTSKSFLASLPLIGGLMDRSKRFVAKYNTVKEQIDRITNELEKARMELTKDISLFDQLYNKNLEYYKELEHYIEAGDQKLKEFQEEVIPDMKAKVETSEDMVEVQKYNDLVESVNRFEKKLHDLKLSKTLSLQTAPQIRLVQNGNSLLVEKIQSTVLNTIPLWKNQIVIALGLFRQQKALEMQKKVTQTTNDLIKRNSEMLKMGTIEIQKEAQKGIIEIETLKKVNSDLIETINETLRIQDEGRRKRAEGEREIKIIEKELKEKLLASK